MPAYRYRAINMTGHITRGAVVAANEWDLAQYLRAAGLELICARTVATIPIRLWQRPVALAKLVPFVTHMRDLLKAGISFAEALSNVLEITEDGRLRDIITDIYRAVTQGTDIAQAFARHKTVFSPVFIAILSAGIASGDLAHTFAHLAHYTETCFATQRYMKRALRYPLFLMIITTGVIIFMMTLVIPQILQFLRSLDASLPLATQILIAVSDYFSTYWWGVALCGTLLFTIAIMGRRLSPQIEYHFDAFSLRMPCIGNIIRQLAYVRFMESLTLLFQSNISILASLREARATLANRVLESEILLVESRVRSGSPLSRAVDAVLPPLAVRMIRAGERSGLLAQSLNDAATYCQNEMKEKVDRFLAMLEPGLTILMGGLLAWVVLAVLGPIYSNLAKLNLTY